MTVLREDGKRITEKRLMAWHCRYDCLRFRIGKVKQNIDHLTKFLTFFLIELEFNFSSKYEGKRMKKEHKIYVQPQKRKQHYTRMSSEDFQAICQLLFEKPRPTVSYRILGDTNRIQQ